MDKEQRKQVEELYVKLGRKPLTCPSCEGKNVERKVEENYKFKHYVTRDKKEWFEITCAIPYIHCRDCGTGYTGAGYEFAKARAIIEAYADEMGLRIQVLGFKEDE